LEKIQPAWEKGWAWLKTAVSCATVYFTFDWISHLPSGLGWIALLYALILGGMVFAVCRAATSAVVGPGLFLMMVAGIETPIQSLVLLTILGYLGFAVLSWRMGLPGWVTVAIILAGCIAYIGGSQGGGGAMVRFLMTDWRYSEEDARFTTFCVRKLVHLNFYGFCAVTWYRCALPRLTNAVPLAITATFSLAAFDESRQLFAPNRTGTPVDVGIDMAGAILFLTIAAFSTKRPANHEGGA
jgi:hypothetical protein